MTLKEFKDKIDDMYNKYGDVGEVCIGLKKDDLFETLNSYFTDNILDITETYDTNNKVNGICISNYIMEER